MQSICVYLGAKPGHDNQLTDAATALGGAIATAGYRLIYGGSSQGLMGILANAVMSHGGLVTGIIPKQLILQEKPLKSLNELIVTDSMQERKRLMEQRADGFITMPGGLGTLEETFQTWSAIKIGILNKPIGFLNINGYFDDLFVFIARCVKSGLISAHHANIPNINANPQLLLASLSQHQASVKSEALV